MLFTDILRTAFMNLWRRKLRAVLTVLGMVIGVSSIVVMMSLGIGIKKSTMESYASMGSLTNITAGAIRKPPRAAPTPRKSWTKKRSRPSKRYPA